MCMITAIEAAGIQPERLNKIRQNVFDNPDYRQKVAEIQRGFEQGFHGKQEPVELPEVAQDCGPETVSGKSMEDDSLVEAKLRILTEIFPLDEFRHHSFAYFDLQQSLRKPIEIHQTAGAIQRQIEEEAPIREEVHKAPDFISALLPQRIQKDEGVKEDGDSGVALDQMVIDETRSPFGADFYDHFHDNLDIPDHPGGVMIRVMEQPAPGRGSQMIIEVNYENVYQFQLQPGYEQVVELAEAVAEGLNQYLEDMDQHAAEYF